MRGDFHGADTFFHVLPVEEGHGALGFRVELEGNLDLFHLLAERFFLNASVGIEQSVFQTIQCNGPVHGAAVYIDVSDFFG